MTHTARSTGSTRHGRTRRDVLRGSLLLGAALPSVALWSEGARAQSSDLDITSRAVFDQLDMSFNGGNGWKEETNDKDSSGLSGKLAWGQAYSLQAYVLMYQTYKDTYYLDKIIDHVDHVLANRDSERGVVDYQGKSHPAWRADHHYTTGAVVVPDASGRPALEVRTAMAYADEAIAVITAGSTPGTFGLDVTHHFYGRTTSYQNLSLDPTSSNYAVDRVLRGFRTEKPQRVQVTVKDVREGPRGADALVPGAYPLVSKPYVFEVHTGQIVLPMVEFARIVLSDPRLAANPLYNSRAKAYVRAVELAVAVHDPEWRENEQGEGYYVSLPGAPTWWAGTDNPINHFLALGRAVLQLGVVTRKRTYIDRAVKMARLLRNDLHQDAGGAYVWAYWWSQGAAYNGWDIDAPKSEYRPWLPGNPVAEDTSHSQIDVNFALDAFRYGSIIRGDTGPIFTGHDMARFAATFTNNIAVTSGDGLLTVHKYIDGTGDTGLVAYERQSAAWADLTPWDSSILTHLRGMLSRQALDPLPSTLYCVARLNHAAKQLPR